MKILIPVVFLLASCGASHKLKQSQEKTVDSISTATRDTVHVTKEEKNSSNLSAQDVHVKISYRPLDSAMAAYIRGLYAQWPANGSGSDPTAPAGGGLGGQTIARADPGKNLGNKPAKAITDIAHAIQSAISATGLPGQIPAEVEIDIGNISSGTTMTAKSDSTAGHATAQTDLHTTEKSKSKEVTHEGMPSLVQLGLWLLLILVIVGIGYVWWKKPAIVKNIITKLLNI